MGDPEAAAQARRAPNAGDPRKFVEPAARDGREVNLTPVGCIRYSASTVTGVPTSLAKETGLALGARAGGRRLVEVTRAGDCTQRSQIARRSLKVVPMAT